ncbi:conjugative relaxase domain-containing protein, TrwC/TraI family [Sanguibacter gelidistatuariae]|uniref:Conjugative relaxase domain-containing protein, TrwC/TraI family n=2 Tax=Sanguibacter gelidistatuariae TaxID=1814289 RepID=A0A1G6SWG2_9MICO|nr:conjugative relaxase domain-containing protein, TrwC/TraI family [Sanguibacter gelidistatuariae]
MVMTLHRLSAGAGYQYLLKHTAAGDCDRAGVAPLTAYYTESGNPPGRWLGKGLAAVDLDVGALVTEATMANLFGAGRHPVSGQPLGKAYPVYAPPADRIAAQIEKLPPDLDPAQREAAVATITRVELSRNRPAAVAGFDLTFTPTKSVSTLWAVADPGTQQAILDAHRAAVQDTLDFAEQSALFTRTGTRGCMQVPVRGMLATAFDHWDSRAGDPNLHTHVVIANKVQGHDGKWRSLDSRALHHAVVALSEIYDDHLADHLSAAAPVTWSWRDLGPRRSPGFELDGIDSTLMREFSTRTTQIDEAMTATLAEFHAAHGRAPNPVEITRLRQQVTRATRPAKHVHPIGELFARWRARATTCTGRTPEELTAAALTRSQTRPLTAAMVGPDVVAHLADRAIGEVMARRSTWTRWNLLAEAARLTRGVRMATPAERRMVLDLVTDQALARCVNLEAPQLFTVPSDYQRPDGTSLFDRAGEAKFTDERILGAEARLLEATTDTCAPKVTAAAATLATEVPVARAGSTPVRLAADQVAATIAVTTSGRRLEALVGPAGTGKTTTMAAIKTAWERDYGRGSVRGLAPSAAAAGELSKALGIACENTAKWLYETTGNGATKRTALLETLGAKRAAATGDQIRQATIDTAAASLQTDAARWALRRGELLIIDEASLAGTLTLDAITAQASAAGAKVLLVGDHAQLCAIDAGGAFNLIAERTHPATLSSLWRFTHPWEAAATLQLRTGQAAVIETYTDHDRISAGPPEVMLEEAYTAWARDTAAGRPAILIAPDSHTVRALNHRAHNDLVTDGRVASDGITTATGTVIARGDRILTRANDRRLRLPGRHIRNGDLWTVTATHDDGSLTVTPVTDPDTATAAAVEELRLPASYVAEHVDLGYATTTHRAQGITTGHAHVLAAAGMTRENLYVAMTRGRNTNHAYVATDDVDPDCDHLPNPPSPAAGAAILERILATSGAELSATQTITANYNAAESLAHLEPIRQALLADAAHRHWDAALAATQLDPDVVDDIMASPHRDALYTVLNCGAAHGYVMDTVVNSLLEREGPDSSSIGIDAPDAAAWLATQLTEWLSTRTEDPYSAPTSDDVLIDPADPATPVIDELEGLIRSRVQTLADLAIATRPSWTHEHGPEPDDADAHRGWRAEIEAHAARIDYTQGPTHAPRPAPSPVMEL